jgi:hypothetical protein
MTIEEAIEVQTIHNDHNPNFTDAERRAAHQLGVEALKRIEAIRKHQSYSVFPSLPGETKEE